MFEGKHIHFSPLDNKPLCSYSSKLCRQRRLNGYAFCIRHILEDKSAPFKQCSFVTRNNYQKCLNAIPSNQERGYCHSHMQVAGIIPKTERKSKTGSSTNNNNNSSNNNNNSSVHSNNNGSSTQLVKKPATSSSDGCGAAAAGGDSKCEQNSAAANTTSSDYKTIVVGPKVTPTSVNFLSNNNVGLKNTSGGLKNSPGGLKNPPGSLKNPPGSLKNSPACLKNPPGNLKNPPGNLKNPPGNVKNPPGKVKSAMTTTTIPAPAVTATAEKGKNNRVLAGKNNKINVNLSNGTGKTHAPTSGNTVKKEARSKSAKQQQQAGESLENGNNNTKPKKKPVKNAGGINNKTLPSSNLSNKPKIPDGNVIQESSSQNPSYTLCVRDRWKSFKFLAEPEENKPAMKLERINAIRALEKLPLFVESPALKSDSKSSSNSAGTDMSRHIEKSFVDLPSSCDVLFVPPFLTKSRLMIKNASDSTTKKNPADYTNNNKEDSAGQNGRADGKSSSFVSEYQQWEWETRKEFLARVRQAFKHQYKTIRKACKLNEKVEKNEKSFRSALLACARTDSTMCAKILTLEETKLNGDIQKGTGDMRTVTGDMRTPIGDMKNVPAEEFIRSSGTQAVNSQLSHAMKFNGLRDDPLLHNGGSLMNGMDFKKSDSIKNKSKFQDDILLHSTNQAAQKAKINGSFTPWQVGPEQKIIKTANNKKSSKNPKPNGVPKSKPIKGVSSTNKINDDANGGVEGPKKKAKKVVASGTGKQAAKKRKVESNTMNDLSVGDLEFKPEAMSTNILMDPSHHDLLRDPMDSSSEKLLPCSVAGVSGLETVLNSVSSSDAAATPEGVITDASFDSPFDHSTSSHPDVEFSDDDLEKSFELQIDPEIAHQASRLFEDNGLTEDDFNELFPETRIGDHKMIGRAADLSDLGIDFTSNFDASDIDYSLFANIFPNFRSNQPESISVNQQF